jgi:hypothetical protein
MQFTIHNLNYKILKKTKSKLWKTMLSRLGVKSTFCLPSTPLQHQIDGETKYGMVS